MSIEIRFVAHLIWTMFVERVALLLWEDECLI